MTPGTAGLPPDVGLFPDPPPEEGDPPEPGTITTVDTAFFSATIGALASEALDFKPAVFTAATVTE